jgi:hypothetical protein
LAGVLMRRVASYAERLASYRQARDVEAETLLLLSPDAVAHRYKMSDKGYRHNETVATVLVSGMLA